MSGRCGSYPILQELNERTEGGAGSGLADQHMGALISGKPKFESYKAVETVRLHYNLVRLTKLD